MKTREQQLRRIRLLIAGVIVGLVVSGLTAFPLRHELKLLDAFVRACALPSFIAAWISQIHEGLEKTHAAYPFVAYGTDWLAFGHLVIALFMIGALFIGDCERSGALLSISRPRKHRVNEDGEQRNQ